MGPRLRGDDEDSTLPNIRDIPKTHEGARGVRVCP